jgi:hypothetical protein
VLHLTQSISFYFCFKIPEDSPLVVWDCCEHSIDHKYMRNRIVHCCCRFDKYSSRPSLKNHIYLLTYYPRQYINPEQWPCVSSRCMIPVWNELLLPGIEESCIYCPWPHSCSVTGASKWIRSTTAR